MTEQRPPGVYRDKKDAAKGCFWAMTGIATLVVSSLVALVFLTLVMYGAWHALN